MLKVEFSNMFGEDSANPEAFDQKQSEFSHNFLLTNGRRSSGREPPRSHIMLLLFSFSQSS